MKFNSQICTSREQSERLLALGLKKETADIVHYFSQSLAQDWTIVPLADGESARYIQGLEIPAWSLDRLRELAICNIEMNIFLSRRCGWINKPHHDPVSIDRPGALFDCFINYIEWLIKEGYFKEYLEE